MATTNQKIQWMDNMNAAAARMVRNPTRPYSTSTSTRSALRDVVQTWYSLSLSTELTQGDIDAMDKYNGITVAEVAAVVTTFEAFETWIDAGHDDNLEKVVVEE